MSVDIYIFIYIPQHPFLKFAHLISANVRPTFFPFNFKIISEVKHVVLCPLVIFFISYSVEDLNIFSVNCSFS